jgi:hypothetical protein
MTVNLHRRALVFDSIEERRDNRPRAIQHSHERLTDEAALKLLGRERGQDQTAVVEGVDQHRNGISTIDLTVLLNAVLDVIGVPVTERHYAKALAAMESALLEESAHRASRL